MNIAGMILGIVGLVFAFVPVIGAFVAIPCVMVGIPLSVVGLVRGRQKQQGTGMAVAGIATNAVAVVVIVVWLAIIGAAVDAVDDDIGGGLFTGDGRAFMMAQPCRDVLAEYNAMRSIGHNSAIQHVSNVYNIKADLNTYVSVSDAQARYDSCR